jgi:hypothetical protein
METLKVKISPSEKKRLKINQNEIDFSEFERLIKLAIARDRMKKVVQSARTSGLSKMTSQEIDTKIKAYRRSAKANR